MPAHAALGGALLEVVEDLLGDLVRARVRVRLRVRGRG